MAYPKSYANREILPLQELQLQQLVANVKDV